ncbi:MAG: Unknown protein [uncultured Sulfurovum sp.]|uniref:Uncharacterized protein n=1 Tax=uncultured Sulfurovum sp. TaxID=269237 RepID=A0A6S6SNU7_9BACT|nr:MAG: Unknown protein [uncultured Sulfurovum sp.]
MKSQYDKFHDLFVSDTAQDVTVQHIDDDGNLVDKTIGNLAKKKREVDDFINGGVPSFFRKSFSVDNTTIWEKLALLPSGGAIFLTLTEDVVWDRDITKDNVSIVINVNGHNLQLKEKFYDSDNTLLFGLKCSNSSVSISGNNLSGSTLTLLSKTFPGQTRTHSTFLCSSNTGFADNNTLALGYGLKVVDNGDFGLISTKAGSSLSASGVTLESENRTWKDLVYGLQIVNGVAKNFSTNISLD